MESGHSEAHHLDCINSMCRLCGNKTKRNVKELGRKVTQCVEFEVDISNYFSITLGHDIEGVHSPFLCLLCTTKLRNLRRGQKTQVTIHHLSEDIDLCKHIWIPYEQTMSLQDCSTCSHYQTLSKGGRPKNAQSFNLATPVYNTDVVSLVKHTFGLCLC